MAKEVIDNVSIVAVVAIIAAVAIVALVFGRSFSFRGDSDQIHIKTSGETRPETSHTVENVESLTSGGA